MRVVLDTNIVVSALISTAGPPARLIDAAVEGIITPVLDTRILAEYEEVTSRARFVRLFDAKLARALLGRLRELGAFLDNVPRYEGELPDDSDRPFVEVALAGGALLVTGNMRHFPASTGVEALTPAQALLRLV
jgi:uncharacterized protein